MARKRKQPVSEPAHSCAHLEDRIARVEKLLSKHFGASIEQLAENPGDDPVVEEKRYDRSVIKIHQSGRLEHLRLCQYCKAEVADLPSHMAVCPKRPQY